MVYTTRHREDRDASDVINGAFTMHSHPYFTLIGCGSTHSYIANSVSGNLGISTEDTSSEISMISPLE